MVKYTSMSTTPSSRRASRTTLAVIGVILLITGGTTYGVLHERRVAETGTDAAKTLVADSASPYTDLAGQPFSFAAYRGKIRVVNVWASWSPYSAKELPMLNTIATQYADKNVVVIAVDRKEDRFRAAAYLKTIPSTSRVHIAIDQTDSYYHSIGGYAMPETLVYNTDGAIVLHKRGPITQSELGTELHKLVK